MALGEPHEQFHRRRGALVAVVGLDNDGTLHDGGKRLVVALQVILRPAVVGGTRNEDDARVAFRGESFAVSCKFQHLVRAAPLHAKAEAGAESFRRFRKRGHAALLLFRRQQVDGIVRLRPDYALDSRRICPFRFLDERIVVHRSVGEIWRSKDRIGAADVG